MKSFEDVPEELVEKIFQHLSVYGEIQACRLVSHQWNRLTAGVMRRVHKLLCRSNRFEWFLLDTPRGSEYHPTTNIAERCSHAAAFHPGTASVFVFGGCTASYTTFNDLWRFDLSRNLWIRPMPMGNYPTPKACASLLEYRGYLILFGGWSKSSPNPIHQTVMFFRELHIYDPKTNFWTEITWDPSTGPQVPPTVAGHSASMSGDRMLVFGGSYGSEHNFGGGLHGSGISNSVWVFDFTTSRWSLPATSTPKPAPRYGQTQIKLDDRRVLIVGGCGGPNLMFSDVWLLTIVDEGEWHWHEVTVVNAELSPPHIWSHQGCRVGDRVLFLSKPLHSRTTSASYRSIGKAARGAIPSRGSGGLDIRHRTWIPPTVDSLGPAGPSTSGSNLVPPRRRLISSKSLDEKNPPPSPSSERLGDKRTAGELQRARSIPAIIVGEIPKLVVTHDGNDSGSSSGGESSDSQLKDERSKEKRSNKKAAGQRAAVSNSTVPVLAEPLDISVVVQRNAQPNPNWSRQCVAMASSNLIPNQAEMVEAPGDHPNMEVDHSYRQAVVRGDMPNVQVVDDMSPVNPQRRSTSVSSSSSDDGSSLPPGPSRVVRNTRHPSVKPNASNNRQKQLEMLRRMEEFLRSRNIAAASSSPDHSASSSGGTSPTALRFRPSSPPPKTRHHGARAAMARPSRRNPMQIYSLDIRPVVDGELRAVWSVLDESIDDAPEDTILYSLVKGRGDLILFGGMRSGTSADTPGNLDVTPYNHLHLITNETYILKPAGLPVD